MRSLQLVDTRYYIGLPWWQQSVKNPPAMWETWVRSLDWEDPLEEGMATHSSILEDPQGQRNLAGCSPWGLKESDMTRQPSTSTRDSMRVVLIYTQVALVVKNPPANAGRRKRCGFNPWVRDWRPPRGGHDKPLQDSCLENPMDRGAWWATVPGVSESVTTEMTALRHTLLYIK